MIDAKSFRLSSSALAAVGLSFGLLVCPSRSQAATSGANGTHDPSRMIQSDGKFYVYSTGGGSKSSTDGIVWTNGPGLFPNGIPSAATTAVPNDEGVWAPDVIFLNNQYYIYYAVANSKNQCAVGLVTTPTLDPSSPSYKLTDRGVAVSNPVNATYCAIDPCPILDASGNLWLSFGSGYTKSSTANTIYVMKLNNTTGLPSSPSDAPGTPLEPGHIEASYIYYHAGYYYLFWNSGGCCSGASSTYEIHVARSQTITGQYTGARIFLQSAGSVHGPGQIGIYDQCGQDRFTYHYYPDSGGSVLGENELSWGSDGFPVAGAASTAMKACGQSNPVVAGGGGGDAGSVADDAGGQDDGSGAPQQTPDADLGGDDAATPGSSVSGSGSDDTGGDGGPTSGGFTSGSTTGTPTGGGNPSTTGSTGLRGSSAGSGSLGGGGPAGSVASGSGGPSDGSGGCSVTSSAKRGGDEGLELFAALSVWAVVRRRRTNVTSRRP